MTLLADLHRDHINLDQLLDALDVKLAHLKKGERPDLHLLSELIDYVGHYADTSHHPREDLMYAYFRGRDAALDELFDQCEAEHGRLRQASAELSETLDAVMHDAVVPLERLTEQLERFVALEQAHLDFEESRIFPRLEAMASDADWRFLAVQIETPQDPLFGERQSQEYRRIYQSLLTEARA